METDTSMFSGGFTGVVPAACDAEAGEALRRQRPMDDAVAGASGEGDGADRSGPDSDGALSERHALPVRMFRSVMSELCSAIRSALDDERGTAEDSLRRAAEILQQFGEAPPAGREEVRGGLAPWQIRKVTHYVESRLDQPIRNEELAAIARLNPSHFGRAFRNSVGEPPHEYVIRRRVERAQGLMLSTDAPLSEIALNCGLADQSHLTRLFRRIVGESPRAWRRARLGEPAECA